MPGSKIMYNNNKYDFDHDLIAEISKSQPQPKEKIQSIRVRDYDFWQQDASFANGISNLGVVFAVATNEEIDKNKIKPYKCQMTIDGEEYKIIMIKQQSSSIGGLNNYKERRKETIFFLG